MTKLLFFNSEQLQSSINMCVSNVFSAYQDLTKDISCCLSNSVSQWQQHLKTIPCQVCKPLCWVWRSSNSMPGSSWITEFLAHKQTWATPQRNLISATSLLALCLCQSLSRVHDHRWGTEWISTCKLNNTSPLFYQTQSISLFKHVTVGNRPTLLFFN